MRLPKRGCMGPFNRETGTKYPCTYSSRYKVTSSFRDRGPKFVCGKHLTWAVESFQDPSDDEFEAVVVEPLE